MNRHQRRRARRMARHNRFYETYVQYLPQVAPDAPLEPGRVYHLVFHHDEWCAFYSGQECNCRPRISRHVEPSRS
jgi:hypothetical protein